MLKVGAATYQVRLDVRAAIAVEAEFGLPIGGVVKLLADSQSMRVTDLGRFVRHTLVRDGERVAPEVAQEVFESLRVPAVADAVGEAVQAFFTAEAAP